VHSTQPTPPSPTPAQEREQTFATMDRRRRLNMLISAWGCPLENWHVRARAWRTAQKVALRQEIRGGRLPWAAMRGSLSPGQWVLTTHNAHGAVWLESFERAAHLEDALGEALSDLRRPLCVYDLDSPAVLPIGGFIGDLVEVITPDLHGIGRVVDRDDRNPAVLLGIARAGEHTPGVWINAQDVRRRRRANRYYEPLNLPHRHQARARQGEWTFEDLQLPSELYDRL
jgi:hypothetical protein